MIVLLDTSQDFGQCESELGCSVEQLFTPLTRYKPQRPDARFAIDNGAYANFNPKAYRSLLAREEPRMRLCRFVCVPDIVGSARRTCEVFHRWYGELCEWPLAFVCQDGQESLDIPWDEVAAVFIGGTDDWKLGPHGIACIKAAQALEKWVHVGRVNTPARFEHCERLGVDSIDGTGLSRYTHMREKIYLSATAPELIPA